MLLNPFSPSAPVPPRIPKAVMNNLVLLQQNGQIRLTQVEVDMRQSTASLADVVQTTYGLDPAGGDLFLFTNERRTRVKAIRWDNSTPCTLMIRTSPRELRLPYVRPWTCLLPQKGTFILTCEQMLGMLQGDKPDVVMTLAPACQENQHLLNGKYDEVDVSALLKRIQSARSATHAMRSAVADVNAATW